MLYALAILAVPIIVFLMLVSVAAREVVFDIAANFYNGCKDFFSKKKIVNNGDEMPFDEREIYHPKNKN